MRIAIIQYGVLHDRFETLRAGGEETYYAQRYSVDFVAELSERHEFVGVCGVLGETPDVVELRPNLHSACIPLIDGAVDAKAVIALLEKWRPDRLILQAPVRPILRWALQNNVDTLPLLADSFEEKSLRHRYRAFTLSRLLRSHKIRAVGNHNNPASLSLRRIGVQPDKIFPWDWPHELRPENNPVKSLGGKPPVLVFVGSFATAKGVEDCIDAAAILRDSGQPFEMVLIGAGSYFEAAGQKISSLGLAGHITLPGRLSHEEVVKNLRAATISMAPSHHIYPEGLPMTIYESLATRTPLALSDHPMFKLYFADTPAARMVPEKNAEALAASIKSLLSDPHAYKAASSATAELWNRVKCDLTWGGLIDAWLSPEKDGLTGIRDYALDRQISSLSK